MAQGNVNKRFTQFEEHSSRHNQRLTANTTPVRDTLLRLSMVSDIGWLWRRFGGFCNIRMSRDAETLKIQWFQQDGATPIPLKKTGRGCGSASGSA